MVTDGKLAEVFARTRVGVAHYSSSLMEGVAHGAVPLVYDPTEGSRYSPDVETAGREIPRQPSLSDGSSLEDTFCHSEKKVPARKK